MVKYDKFLRRSSADILNTKYIKEFVHLAKVLSFSKTAQELGISETALPCLIEPRKESD